MREQKTDTKDTAKVPAFLAKITLKWPMYGEEVQILVNVQQKLRKGIALKSKIDSAVILLWYRANFRGEHMDIEFFINVCVDKTAWNDRHL